jgi:hypothetical protein
MGFLMGKSEPHRIGCGENLQERPIFDGKTHGFPVDFPLNQSNEGIYWIDVMMSEKQHAKRVIAI